MKNAENKPVKVIGKNCKHNERIEGIVICYKCLVARIVTKKLCPECANSEIIGSQTRAKHICKLTKK